MGGQSRERVAPHGQVVVKSSLEQPPRSRLFDTALVVCAAGIALAAAVSGRSVLLDVRVFEAYRLEVVELRSRVFSLEERLSKTEALGARIASVEAILAAMRAAEAASQSVSALEAVRPAPLDGDFLASLEAADPVAVGLAVTPRTDLARRVDELDRHVAGLYAARGHHLYLTPQGSRRLQGLQTGSAVEASDVELLIRLCDAVKPRRVFGVGNAFGFSSLVLSHACNNAPLDVLDAEIDDGGGVNRGIGHNIRGTALTHQIAHEEGRDVRVTVGFSPQATPKALRGENGTYSLAFIDGQHSDRNMVADFLGIRRAMGPKAVAIFHDVGIFGMWRGVERALAAHPGASYRTFEATTAKNRVGTGFLYWGYPPGAFEDFGPAFRKT